MVVGTRDSSQVALKMCVAVFYIAIGEGVTFRE